MTTANQYPMYSNSERIADGVVHLLGIGLAIVGVILLLGSPDQHGTQAIHVALCVYSAGLLTMLTASAVYHFAAYTSYRPLLRRIDHAAIYIKIAATVTPLAILSGTKFTITTLILIWLCALVGASFKLMARPGQIGTAWLPHLCLSWLGGLVILSQTQVLGAHSMYCLAAGGLVYSGALIFYCAEKLPFANALWHGGVAIASGFMYFGVVFAVTSI